MSSNFGELKRAAYDEAAEFALPEGWEEHRPVREAYAIDPRRTMSRDDALSADEDTFVVHFPDAGTFIDPDSTVAEYAEAMGQTRYWPRIRRSMLPEDISEGPLSLRGVQAIPTVDVNFSLTDDEIVSEGISRGQVYATPWAYRAFEDALEGLGTHEEVPQARRFYDLAQDLLEDRQEEGALADYDPATETVIDESGRVGTLSRGQFAVREAMIVANTEVAGTLAEAGTGIFRRQDPPDTDMGVEEIREVLLEGDSAAIAELGLKPGYFSTTPGEHAGFATIYADASAPLNRYAALVNHIDLADVLDDHEPRISPERHEEIVDRLNALESRIADQPRWGQAGRPRSPLGLPDARTLYETIQEAAQEGEASDALITTVSQCAEAEILTPRELTSILFNPSRERAGWRALTEVAEDYLSRHPHHATNILYALNDQGVVDEPEIAIYEDAPAYVGRGELPGLPPVEAEGPNQKLTTHSTAYKLLRRVLER